MVQLGQSQLLPWALLFPSVWNSQVWAVPGCGLPAAIQTGRHGRKPSGDHRLDQGLEQEHTVRKGRLLSWAPSTQRRGGREET